MTRCGGCCDYGGCGGCDDYGESGDAEDLGDVEATMLGASRALMEQPMEKANVKKKE